MSGAYVLLVSVLALVATGDPNQVNRAPLVLALVLCLPVLVAGLAPLYIVIALAWNMTGADHGGPTWPVTMSYVLAFAAMACVNALVLRALVRRWSVQRGLASGRVTNRQAPTGRG